MDNRGNENRVFLFLQGPHGPFFAHLAKMLNATGAACFKVGFNRGDQFFWSNSKAYIPFRDAQDEWPKRFDALLTSHDVTDIVVYGDTRQIHAEAIKIATKRNIQIHVFEEGYLRPYWVTYERGGSNGHSRLMNMTIEDMRAALDRSDATMPLPPAHWGDMRQHIFYGAAYHWFVMFLNGKYPNFKPHRSLSVSSEFGLYIKRLLTMPYNRIHRRIATTRIAWGGFPYHLVLLQLEHDASFQIHSRFGTMAEFLEEIIENFAKFAPKHHHLVFKSHPLEDGRAKIRKSLKSICEKYGVTDRVHYVRGGKLARLLNAARSAITVNSTAGQQVLWRGIPLKIFGRAIYDKPEFVSELPLPEFFDAPKRPDTQAYRDFRQYLLETSQVPGGFYSRKGRQQLLRLVVDMILDPSDPYDSLRAGTAAPRQQLRIVSTGADS